ncbi:MAG: alpha-1,2-fucosyltransferase [Verrucomicrobia bacterium]|nr:alpha-1,2-fucosyltransferase [Verrucomicrobiota bacterium]
MIIVNIMGGLGNQMFQYATAKRLAVTHNTPLKIDASNFDRCTPNKEHTLQLGSFRITASQASRSEVADYKKTGLKHKLGIAALLKALGLSGEGDEEPSVFSEPAGSAFKPEVLTLGVKTYLIGYFNSYKYFDSVKHLLVEEFTPREPISDAAREVLAAIADSNSVSVHVRRGDYVSDPGIRKDLEGVITERYYQNAVNHVAERVSQPHFFMFSDDIAWVKANLRPPHKTTCVDFNSPQRGFEDLWLMSHCKHNITAGGSTFSWWAAYLNPNKEKVVVRTERTSSNSAYNHPEDYFPPEWVIAKS